MFFHKSFQKENFIFQSQQELDDIRSKCNARAVHRISQLIEDSRSISYLTPQEETLLCQHYMLKMQQVCAIFNPPFPPEVLGTSSSYFKRFYLKNTVMEFDPK
eukprot:Sdes_comp11816_c0_seq1m2870